MKVEMRRVRDKRGVGSEYKYTEYSTVNAFS